LHAVSSDKASIVEVKKGSFAVQTGATEGTGEVKIWTENAESGKWGVEASLKYQGLAVLQIVGGIRLRIKNTNTSGD